MSGHYITAIAPTSGYVSGVDATPTGGAIYAITIDGTGASAKEAASNTF